jgi:hypothetical protein
MKALKELAKLSGIFGFQGCIKHKIKQTRKEEERSCWKI